MGRNAFGTPARQTPLQVKWQASWTRLVAWALFGVTAVLVPARAAEGPLLSAISITGFASLMLNLAIAAKAAS